jgi:hypothetical protein
MRLGSLRQLAEEKRKAAADIRRLGPTLSAADDRELMARHAAEMEKEADRLDAEANRAAGSASPDQ